MRRYAVSLPLGLALVAALVAGGSPTSGASPSPEPAARIDPALSRLLASAAPNDRLTALVHGVDVAAARRAAGDLTSLTEFARVGVVAVRGTPGRIRAAARRPGVTYLQADLAMRPLLDTSHVATRGRELRASTDAAGRPIDGTGISVAVLDSGVDGTHPFFRLPDGTSKVVRNLKVTRPDCQGMEPSAPRVATDFCLTDAAGNDSDTPSNGGHGTHVAGIVAGTDTTTVAPAQVTLSGAAPGARLVAVSVGQGTTTTTSAIGFNWVLNNWRQPCGSGVPASTCPPIRVVNNSFGSVETSGFDPDDIHVKIQRELVREGVVTVWAAGNSAGDGSTATTNPVGQDPTPGVLLVGSYDDRDSGTRNGAMSPFSARGARGRPDTFVDLVAPGAGIRSSCRPTLPICYGGTPYDGPTAEDRGTFTTLSGTSMAAPHVAGIVAQLLQAVTLSPAQVEDVLEDTATQFGATPLEYDARNPTTPTSYDRGHGLVDARAAFDAALALAGTPEPLPTGTAAPARVTLGVDVQRITAGNAPVLSGLVTDAAGRPVPGLTVTLFSKSYGQSAYVSDFRPRTDAAGRFRQSVRPLTQTAYVARAGSVQAPALVVYVSARINIATPAAGSALANPVTVWGQLVPEYAGAPVGLALVTGGRFQVLAQSPTDSRGVFAIRANLPRGTNAFAVFTSARAGTLRGSKSLTLTIR